MVTVRTKDELERALKAGEKRILCKGEIEKKLRKQKKLQTAAKVTGGALAATAAVVGGVLAAPFSGGSSLAGAGAAIGMMGGHCLTCGAVTATSTELFVILGIPSAMALATYGISKDKKVKLNFKKDGVELEVE